MKAKLLHSIRQWPLFLITLPFFYLLHRLNENYAPGVTPVALRLALIYSAASLFLWLLFYALLKNFRKAALVSLYLVAFNFFFGYMHDKAKGILGNSSLPVKYSFIIPAVLILLAVIITWLRRTKRIFGRTFTFLNVLFLAFIAWEMVSLVPKWIRGNMYNPPPLASQFIRCDTCSNPDVYVIIADEYAGRQELKDVFDFDNSVFENALQSRGFRIVNYTNSNYNSTVYSMASLFNMGYINLSAKELETEKDILLCRSIISRNNTGEYFRQLGYSIYNNSFFDFQGQKKAVINYRFHPINQILTFGTFIYRFKKNVGFNFLSNQKIEQIEKKHFNNDEVLDSLTKTVSRNQFSKPKFVYSHFVKPHHPYYTDSSGLSVNFDSKMEDFDQIKKQYIGYLQYTNKRLLQLIDQILKHSAKPPVILLISDHGFRQFPQEADKKYYFMNLCAVHLPSRNYQPFYQGMTTVNIFRAVLNAQFGQRLPILKDSTSFLREKPVQ
jgi:hypothetical protein